LHEVDPLFPPFMFKRRILVSWFKFCNILILIYSLIFSLL
jgi:hypothetical protein